MELVVLQECIEFQRENKDQPGNMAYLVYDFAVKAIPADVKKIIQFKQYEDHPKKFVKFLDETLGKSCSIKRADFLPVSSKHNNKRRLRKNARLAKSKIPTRIRQYLYKYMKYEEGGMWSNIGLLFKEFQMKSEDAMELANVPVTEGENIA